MAINLVLLCYGLVIGEYEFADAMPSEFYQGVPLKCVLKAQWTFFKPRAVTIVMTLFIIYLFIARIFTMTFFGRLLNWLEVELQSQQPDPTTGATRVPPRKQSTITNSDLVIEWPVLRDIPQHPYAMALQKAWVYIRYWRSSARRHFERELSYLQVTKQMEKESTIHDLITQIERCHRPGHSQWYIMTNPAVFHYYMGRINNSFASQLPALFFGLSYGFATLIVLRVKARDLPVSALGLDFGQIVALLLLTLPVLTAFETYFGMFSILTNFTSHIFLALRHPPTSIQPLSSPSNQWHPISPSNRSETQIPLILFVFASLAPSSSQSGGICANFKLIPCVPRISTQCSGLPDASCPRVQGTPTLR